MSQATTEWRRGFMLPIAAAFGYATSNIHVYGLGPFIEPIATEFGWTRAQVTSGQMLSSLLNAAVCLGMGVLVDRWGPRRIGIVGAPLILVMLALLGTATGSISNWYLLWTGLAVAAFATQATIWTAAVASRFDASRGLALAVTLCGASLGSAIFPVLGAWLIGAYGWRSAYAMEALAWGVLTVPLVLFFFHGARDRRASNGSTRAAPTEPAAPAEGVTIAEGLRSSVFWRLLLASLLFTFTILGLFVHFVPILTGAGVERLAAAGIASLIGLSAIVGRLATGLLLDRFPAHRVGAAIFVLPAIAAALLLFALDSTAAQVAAAIIVGLTLGSEIDVIVYLATKHFGLRNFGALYGGLLTALSAGTAIGPQAASMIFDAHRSYAPFLWAALACMAASSMLLASLPRARFGH